MAEQTTHCLYIPAEREPDWQKAKGYLSLRPPEQIYCDLADYCYDSDDEATGKARRALRTLEEMWQGQNPYAQVRPIAAAPGLRALEVAVTTSGGEMPWELDAIDIAIATGTAAAAGFLLDLKDVTAKIVGVLDDYGLLHLVVLPGHLEEIQHSSARDPLWNQQMFYTEVSGLHLRIDGTGIYPGGRSRDTDDVVYAGSPVPKADVAIYDIGARRWLTDLQVAREELMVVENLTIEGASLLPKDWCDAIGTLTEGEQGEDLIGVLHAQRGWLHWARRYQGVDVRTVVHDAFPRHGISTSWTPGDGLYVYDTRERLYFDDAPVPPGRVKIYDVASGQWLATPEAAVQAMLHQGCARPGLTIEGLSLLPEVWQKALSRFTEPEVTTREVRARIESLERQQKAIAAELRDLYRRTDPTRLRDAIRAKLPTAVLLEARFTLDSEDDFEPHIEGLTIFDADGEGLLVDEADMLSTLFWVRETPDISYRIHRLRPEAFLSLRFDLETLTAGEIPD